MCFSATASFTAAGILSLIGALSLKTVRKDKSLYLLASIPLFFALQQAAEGVLWLQLPEAKTGLTEFSTAVFLIIAFLIWPILIPLALWRAERIPWRKNLISVFVAAGVAWSVYMIVSLSFFTPQAQIVNNSIQYTANYYSLNALSYFTLLYISIVLGPTFISSLRYLWVFGFFAIISALFSYQIYTENFTSVWCFFAALISMEIYLVLRESHHPQL